MPSILDLPDPLLEFILYNVSPYGDIKSCSLVCKGWYRCCLRVMAKRHQLFKQALIDGPLSYSSYVDPYNNVYPQTSAFSTKRSSHSACIYGNSMYVFGGCTPTHTTFNDLWKIDLTTRKMERVVTTGNYPTPKSHAVMLVWNDCLLLFGGWATPFTYPQQLDDILFDEFHSYNIKMNVWTECIFSESPPATAGHSATIHGDVMVFFGGEHKVHNVCCKSNEVYCLDLITRRWYWPTVSEICPSPRYGHSQIKIDDRHIIVMSGFGGYNHLHYDTWLLTVPENVRNPDETWIWKQLDVEGADNMPKQVWCNPCCKVDENIVVLTRKNETEGSQITSAQFLFRPARSNLMNDDLPQPRNIRSNANANSPQGFVGTPPPSPTFERRNEQEVSEAISLPTSGHSRPSVRPNASSDRERRLSVLSKYEDRIREMAFERALNLSPGAASVSHLNRKRYEQKAACTLAVYLMNVSRVLQEGIVSWSKGPAWIGGDAPHPRMLCSVSLGRGELVLCGGKRTGFCECNEPDSWPPVLYISAPGIGPP